MTTKTTHAATDSPTNRFPHEWRLSDGYPPKNGLTVFSCFACGGGSTMGYKLAGFDVIGCNEIDPQMADCYKINHSPKYCFVEPIQTFKDRGDLPPELFDLDVLDGSPPCSSFSMAGNREGDWGKKKQFREGQSEQVLDTLFFDFIELGKKLQPKIIVAENVKGLLMGEAKSYVSRILTTFDEAGYFVDYQLLDASTMGVPQKRERVFFYAVRKDIYTGAFLDLWGTRPLLDLDFKLPKIQFSLCADGSGTSLTYLYHARWERRAHGDFDFGDITMRTEGKRKCFSDKLIHHDRVCCTITSGSYMVDFESGLLLSDLALCRVGTYPTDYKFGKNKAQYLIGMSVPPVMMAHIASTIKEQWLDNMQIVKRKGD